MIRFLLKGLLRDSSRSRLPIIVVSVGVALTVLMHTYITGIMGDTIDVNARFFTGHLKVMTRAYAAGRRLSRFSPDIALFFKSLWSLTNPSLDSYL